MHHCKIKAGHRCTRYTACLQHSILLYGFCPHDAGMGADGQYNVGRKSGSDDVSFHAGEPADEPVLKHLAAVGIFTSSRVSFLSPTPLFSVFHKRIIDNTAPSAYTYGHITFSSAHRESLRAQSSCRG